MSVTIPLRNDLQFYRFQVNLDDRTFGMEFRWNAQAEAWFMSLFTVEDEPIIVGLRVVEGWFLGKRYKSELMPQGTFIAMDTTGQRQDPGLTDLGKRVELYYFSAGE